MVLKILGPPSSPPTAGVLLIIKMAIARRASIQKMVTENPKLKKRRVYIQMQSHNAYTRETRHIVLFKWCSFSPANRHNEDLSLGLPVDSSHGPGDTNTKEDVDSVRASDVTDRGISSFILNSSCL
jgi:hypothetical protein